MVSLIKKVIGIVPPRISTWGYTRLLNIWPLRQMANAVIRSTIPRQIGITEGVLLLNPDDVAVSGQLALNVYEKFETEIFRKTIKPGMNFVDIGANIGYYAIIAGHIVGKNGKVIAYEPEPENHRLLKSNIEINSLPNVIPLSAALSSKNGSHRLFVTSDNKGTHSLVDNRNSGSYIMVETETLDGSLAKLGIKKIDVIKIDIEGAESVALDGMIETIKTNRDIVIFLELHPRAIARFGRSPKRILEILTDLGFKLHIIDENKKAMYLLEPSNFDDFMESFPKNRDAGKNIYALRGTLQL